MPLTVKHAKSDTIADFTGTVTVLNSAGATMTMSATDLVRPVDWNSAHALTFNVAATDIFSAGLFEPFFNLNSNSTAATQGAGTWFLDPFVLPYGLGSGQINVLFNAGAGFLNGTTFSAASTGSVSRSQTCNSQIALYQLGTGANSTRIESLWSTEISDKWSWERRVTATATNALTVSNYLTLSLPSQYDASGGITYGTTTASGTTSNNASTAASTVADGLITSVVAFGSGPRMLAFPFATTIPPGIYYFGWMISSTSSSSGTNYSQGTMVANPSMHGMLGLVNRAFKAPGKSVSNVSTVIPSFHGSVATTSSAPFSTLATSDLRNMANPYRRAWTYAQTSW